MKKTNIIFILIACLSITACGSNKRNISMKVHSDPLGAYALMQVKYKGNENSDWIYLGPTPITLDKSIAFDGAAEVSIKVIRPGFYEQTKSWTPKDFIKEHKQQNGILWVPSMVQQ